MSHKKVFIILLYISYILMVMGYLLTQYDLKNKLEVGKKVNGRFIYKYLCLIDFSLSAYV